MPATISNEEFGRRVGVSHSMASRMRSGVRLPGVRTMARISKEFGIPLEELVAKHEEGPEAFGAMLRRRVR